MKKPFSFAEYNIILDDRANYNLYKVVISIFIIVIIILICKFKFYVYQTNILLRKDNYYELVIEMNQINNISTSKKIIINKKEYAYRIVDYGNNYSNINGTIYHTILIEIKEYISNDDVIECSFLKKKETLLDMLLEFMQGG